MKYAEPLHLDAPESARRVTAVMHPPSPQGPLAFIDVISTLIVINRIVPVQPQPNAPTTCPWYEWYHFLWNLYSYRPQDIHELPFPAHGLVIPRIRCPDLSGTSPRDTDMQMDILMLTLSTMCIVQHGHSVHIRVTRPKQLGLSCKFFVMFPGKLKALLLRFVT